MPADPGPDPDAEPDGRPLARRLDVAVATKLFAALVITAYLASTMLGPMQPDPRLTRALVLAAVAVLFGDAVRGWRNGQR